MRKTTPLDDHNNHVATSTICMFCSLTEISSERHKVMKPQKKRHSMYHYNIDKMNNKTNMLKNLSKSMEEGTKYVVKDTLD